MADIEKTVAELFKLSWNDPVCPVRYYPQRLDFSP